MRQRKSGVFLLYARSSRFSKRLFFVIDVFENAHFLWYKIQKFSILKN